MSDSERDLDETFRSVVRAAVRDAPMGVDVQLNRGPSRSRRGWLVAAAAVVILAVGVTAIALARRGPSTTVVSDTTPSAATSGSIDPTTTTLTSVSNLSLPGIVPSHGIAYRTASGTVIATVTGEVLFTIQGVHVVDRSRDASTMAAVVALDTDTTTAPQGYALDIGASTMREVGPATDTISYAYGWIADGAPSGCLRDARRQQSTLLLCSSDPTSGPDQIARITTDGTSMEMIPVSPVQQSGHWVNAVTGPDGYIAATWSGECENLSAYLITPDNRTIPLSDSGASAVQGWVDGGVLVSRFGECGTNSTDTELFLVTTTGAESLIPTPGAIETPVVW